jgi:hypothetical protein
MATFKVWQQFVHNPLRKTPYAFVKVVGGSEIYNFPIHHFVHFYSTFGSFAQQGPWARSEAGRRRATSRLPHRTEARAPRRPLPRAHRPEDARPEALRPEASRPEAPRPEGMGVAPTARRTCDAVPAGAVCAAGGEEPVAYKGLSLLVAQGRHLHLALATAGRPAAPVRAARRCQ